MQVQIHVEADVSDEQVLADIVEALETVLPYMADNVDVTVVHV